MLVNHHIAAALASERERDLVEGARRWRRSDPGTEPVRMAPFSAAARPVQPRPEHERDGRIVVRGARAREAESGHSANARARERVASR